MHLLTALLFAATAVKAVNIGDCPGYKATNVVKGSTGLTADLELAGEPCNIYGQDIRDLKLVVEYQTDKRLHVQIADKNEQVYQIQEAIIERPEAKTVHSEESVLNFDLKESPFSFTVSRRRDGEVLFDTSSEQLIFESQYVRLRTLLPTNPNIYGLGEHSDHFRLRTESTNKRTMWNCESPFIPRGRNLYGSQPMYLEHRQNGTHGVMLMNANGMDINLDKDESGRQYLEYNTIGGILDFYFFAGPSPTEVSMQHAEAIGHAAMVPYWSLGFHQAKYGYWDINILAEMVANYSAAGIPLEVVWGDIDYMYLRRDFTTDTGNFPLVKTREFVATLHEMQKKWVMMLDPGISNGKDYDTFTRGHEQGAFLKAADGSDYRGVQWAGEVVWPDYASDEARAWWTDEILRFFNPDSGLNVDGIWNDMNEVSNFCPDTNCNPTQHAQNANLPPAPPTPRNNTGRPIPGFPQSFQPGADRLQLQVRQDTSPSVAGDKKGLPDRNWFDPPYAINNLKGKISDATLWTNITNHDGTRQYDTHNLYGLTMAKATYQSMTKRRPGKRPFVLTRSNFLSSSKWAAHWFGDNYSAWDDYRISIYQMLGYSAVHNYPMVGSDVCGFNGNAQEKMCARWAMLGAFQPFYRNHADISAPEQEFYRWASVTQAARKAIDARYRLLDYIYTAIHRAASKGTPSVNPLFFMYPADANTYAIDHQYFLGTDLLVSPVVEDDATTVTLYLPDNIFYDFWTHKTVRGHGANITLADVGFDEIPVYIRGGSIIPLRSESANTTTEVRGMPFTLIVAPGLDGKAKGSLVVDDGESIDGETSTIQFSWDGSTLKADGDYGFSSEAEIENIVILGGDGDKAMESKGSWSLNRGFRSRIS